MYVSYPFHLYDNLLVVFLLPGNNTEHTKSILTQNKYRE